MSNETLSTQVAVIGAGPVGMTLAMDLAHRGIDVVIVEQRAADAPADAKCNTVSARTMEIFRRLGCADAVRAVGLGDDYPTDVTYGTSAFRADLCRMVLPSRNERFGADGRSARGYPDSHWRTPEPVHRVSQYFLEPVLQQHLASFERVRMLHGTELVRFDDLGDGVRIECRDVERDAPVSIEARYMVGCDGGRSLVRKTLGVALEGDAEFARTRSSLIRAPGMRERFEGRPAWMAWTLNSECTGTTVAIDGDELWLVHRNLPRTARDFDDLDLDASLRGVLGVGADFDYEIVKHEDWKGRRLVASRFRVGNVFIAGDAAHLWIPFAGYGMNAGIADATNLSWMLAAVLEGWADPALLDAHEAERHPITEQVSQFAMRLAMEYMERATRRKIPRALSWRNPIGGLIRKRIGANLHDLNLPQFTCEGLNFGYYYDASPLVRYDEESAPEYSMGAAQSSTVPGCRMPHLWLDDGSSLYDALGDGYTLLRFDDALDATRLERAAAERGVPLKVLDVPAALQDAALGIRHTLILVRPDQHVAWRGDALPEDVAVLVETIRGGSEIASRAVETLAAIA